MTLAPEMKAFLEFAEKAGLPQVWEAPVDVIRRNTQSRPTFAGAVEELKEVANRFIPGNTADLPIRIYRPKQNITDGLPPAIIYFHGGGWVLNFLDIFDASLARLANQSGATIISVNYQKAPEHPFPIPFDDCFTTLNWVRDNADELNIDITRLCVAGDSAGGNLASAVALKARDEGIPLALQILIYPCNDRNFDTPSYIQHATGYGLSTQAMKWFWDQYLQGNNSDKNPYAAPMQAATFKDLAPAVIITAEYDPLLSDAQKYAQLLSDDGVAVIYREYEGMIHGFFSYMAVTPKSQDAIDFVAEQVKALRQ